MQILTPEELTKEVRALDLEIYAVHNKLKKELEEYKIWVQTRAGLALFAFVIWWNWH